MDGPHLPFMDRALDLAHAQLGRTWPNPAVGCVLVRDGEIVGEGATGHGGRPHAEEMALDAAGSAARGASAYVTLEPCRQRTSGAPCCADRLIEAGVRAVVIAVGDPHAWTKGAGEARLRAAGLHVITGVREAEAAALNEGFFHLVRTGQPLVFADPDPTFYDAPFEAEGEVRAALTLMGQAGFTRLVVAPGSAQAARVEAAGLLRPPRPPRSP